MFASNDAKGSWLWSLRSFSLSLCIQETQEGKIQSPWLPFALGETGLNPRSRPAPGTTRSGLPRSAFSRDFSRVLPLAPPEANTAGISFERCLLHRNVREPRDGQARRCRPMGWGEETRQGPVRRSPRRGRRFGRTGQNFGGLATAAEQRSADAAPAAGKRASSLAGEGALASRASQRPSEHEIVQDLEFLLFRVAHDLDFRFPRARFLQNRTSRLRCL